MASELVGTKVYDSFGEWTLEIDGDQWIAVQGKSAVLIMDRADMNRFGIECLPVLS